MVKTIRRRIMKRLLTYEEINFVTEALKYYAEQGPERTHVKKVVVRSTTMEELEKNYQDFPYKVFLEEGKTEGENPWDCTDISFHKEASLDLMKIFNGDPGGEEDSVKDQYYAMIKAYMGTQYGDVYDVNNLLSAIETFTQDLEEEKEKWLKQMKVFGVGDLRKALEQADTDWKEFLIEMVFDGGDHQAYLLDMLKKSRKYAQEGTPEISHGKGHSLNPIVAAMAKANINDWTFDMEDWKTWIYNLKEKLDKVLEEEEIS